MYYCFVVWLWCGFELCLFYCCLGSVWLLLGFVCSRLCFVDFVYYVCLLWFNFDISWLFTFVFAYVQKCCWFAWLFKCCWILWLIVIVALLMRFGCWLFICVLMFFVCLLTNDLRCNWFIVLRLRDFVFVCLPCL